MASYHSQKLGNPHLYSESMLALQCYSQSYQIRRGRGMAPFLSQEVNLQIFRATDMIVMGDRWT